MCIRDRDIIAESISDEADYRIWIRKATVQHGKVISQAKDENAESVYEMYYDFEEPVNRLAGHRVLALNRGEKEKFLTVKIEAPQDDILRYLEKKMIHSDKDVYKRQCSNSTLNACNRCGFGRSFLFSRSFFCC